MPAVGIAILIASSLAAWLHSRRIQPGVDALTARRLSPSDRSADPTAPALNLTGEPIDAHSPS